jgi:hypothetical protein
MTLPDACVPRGAVDASTASDVAIVACRGPAHALPAGRYLACMLHQSIVDVHGCVGTDAAKVLPGTPA